MKKLLASLLLSAVCLTAFTQSINYQKNIDDALSMAAKNNKPVFIMIGTPAAAQLSQQSIVFASGLDSKEATELYNKKFISYRTTITDSAGIKIRDKYHLTTFPAYIFLDAKGGLVYRDDKNSRDAAKFLDMANKALQRIESGKTLSYYENLDKKGTITADQLKEYINYKEDLQLFDNGPLIDEYVSFLTIKQFDDYNTVLFVLKASPLAYGKAFNLCFTNRKIYDSVYKREPVNVRSDINNHIITYTRLEAIKLKDLKMANNAASFAQSTWSRQDPRQGYKTFLSNMMDYYKAVNDTLRYFQQATMYYDTYYMNISTDSAKKLHAKTLQEALNKRIAQNPDMIPSTPKPLNGNIYTAGVVVKSNAPLEVGSRLNTGAWDFYTLGTKNPDRLVKALLWIRRAIQLEPRGYYFDTMAHILYRLDFFDEAVSSESKAIDMIASTEPENKPELDNMKNELKKMKSHSL